MKLLSCLSPSIGTHNYPSLKTIIQRHSHFPKCLPWTLHLPLASFHCTTTPKQHTTAQASRVAFTAVSQEFSDVGKAREVAGPYITVGHQRAPLPSNSRPVFHRSCRGGSNTVATTATAKILVGMQNSKGEARDENYFSTYYAVYIFDLTH